MRAFVASLMGLVLVGSASACINDRELESHEREFRSSYEGDSYEPPAEVTAEDQTMKYVVGGAGATGIVLAVVGGVLVLRMRG